LFFASTVLSNIIIEIHYMFLALGNIAMHFLYFHGLSTSKLFLLLVLYMALEKQLGSSSFFFLSFFIFKLIDQDEFGVFFPSVCGGDSVREQWTNYTQDTDLLVFVVDASNVETLPLAGSELKRILGDERLARVPLLVLANKQVQYNVIPQTKFRVSSNR